jgi:hypothetical protein
MTPLVTVVHCQVHHGISINFITKYCVTDKVIINDLIIVIFAYLSCILLLISASNRPSRAKSQ